MQKGSFQPTFATHLSELRTRVFWILLSFILFSLISFKFYDFLLSILIKPLGQSLYFTSPTGGLDVVIRICLISGFILSLPVIMYHLYKFLEPATNKKPRKIWILFSIFSLVFSGIGILFAYFAALPAALTFLKGFGSNEIKPLITTQEYFTFVTYYILGFAFVFQLPLLMVLINSLYPLRIKTLIKSSRYVIVLCFIAAAIITPTTDVLNLLLMAIPLVLLYFISIGTLFILNRRAKKT